MWGYFQWRKVTSQLGAWQIIYEERGRFYFFRLAWAIAVSRKWTVREWVGLSSLSGLSCAANQTT